MQEWQLDYVGSRFFSVRGGCYFHSPHVDRLTGPDKSFTPGKAVTNDRVRSIFSFAAIGSQLPDLDSTPIR